MQNIENKSILSTSISILLSLSLVVFIVGIILLSRIIISNSIDREKENFVLTIQLNEISNQEIFQKEKKKFRNYLLKSLPKKILEKKMKEMYEIDKSITNKV